MRVLILSKYSEKGASSRYRFYNFKEWFSANGITPVYRPLFGDKYLDLLYRKQTLSKNIVAFWSILKRIFLLCNGSSAFDHVIIEAELFPRLPLWLDRFFLKKMKSYSLDFDDNISANYQGTRLQNKIPVLIKEANFVTVGNHWYLSEFQGNLIYLPTVIDLDKYPQYNSSANRNSTVIWIGSPSTVKYLKLIEKELAELSRDQHFILKIIGGEIELDKSINVEYVKWSSETENQELSESCVGIMPLEDTYWEKGKCGFKLIQYMASGIPVVASPLPANMEIVQHGKNGYIAKTKEDWVSFIKFLLNNPEKRQEMGLNARKQIEKKYSYQVWGDIFSKIIKDTKNVSG